MSRELKALNETLQNLIVMSDALEYVRSKFKKNKDISPYLLKSQESLVEAIKQLKNADITIQERKKKEKRKTQEENIASIEDWKKEQLKKLNEEYQTQMHIMKSEAKSNLKQESVNLLKRDYDAKIKEINNMYEESIRGEY